MKFTKYLILVAVLATLGLSTPLSAQNASESGQTRLEQEILRMDSLLFTAFNNRDQETLGVLFSKDLEFYHDQGGLANYEQNMQATEQLFNRDYVLHRELLPGTTEIHPIRDYGAVQIGRHEFCHEENGKMDCGTFKFIHIWKRLEGGKWELTRVISYDH